MQHLSEQQREQWAIDGYLHLKGQLSADEVAFFNEELDRIRLEPGWEPAGKPLGHYEWLDRCRDTDPEGFMDRRDLLDYGQAFVDLMDRSSVFDLIVDIMGPELMLSMTQAIVRPSTDKFAGYTHTDSGAFTVYPGSHMRPFPWRREEPLTPHSPGAVQLSGQAGDCYLFSHSLWHGPAPNRSGQARKTLLYNYCQSSAIWVTASDPAPTSTCRTTSKR